MTPNSQLRKQALQTLEGHWGAAAGTIFVYLFLALIAGAVLWGIPAVLLLPAGFAVTVMFLDLARGGKADVVSLFAYYKEGRVWWTVLLKAIYVYLWALLLFVPGVIKSYSYAMTEFLMRDNPELSGNAAIERSMQMMSGNKLRLFLLDLSFIGWMILSLLTCGLGFILLIPYMNTAHAKFYEELK